MHEGQKVYAQHYMPCAFGLLERAQRMSQYINPIPSGIVVGKRKVAQIHIEDVFSHARNKSSGRNEVRSAQSDSKDVGRTDGLIMDIGEDGTRPTHPVGWVKG
ncbi:uncharacterized protein PADG_07796 [Paracoccidioides brasiliensis Pb18]|uniref:Uncharacterized protein n=1 Tax=Paracoccidioides brasiliensis (strain Pb18) TaxID=502780 RepID=C1GKL0_PARBD|nr:uncharacterized protein PADG_07796 [Paracoccidioides brasiliensis Pb18]EEH42976.2 hypothetical protein PADG_07796 [Paracoccidioides brasiliensis Pb18]